MKTRKFACFIAGIWIATASVVACTVANAAPSSILGERPDSVLQFGSTTTCWEAKKPQLSGYLICNILIPKDAMKFIEVNLDAAPPQVEEPPIIPETKLKVSM
jgi:hypothetical protein